MDIDQERVLLEKSPSGPEFRRRSIPRTRLNTVPLSDGDTTITDVELANGGSEARRKPRRWKTMPYIIGNDVASQIATYGLTSNLLVYLPTNFSMDLITATNVCNIFSGTWEFVPVVGAFISDAYTGRFPAIVFGSFANLIGMLVLTLSASISGLKPPACSEAAQLAGTCIGPTTLQEAILYIGLTFLVIGSAGVTATSLPFAVDQFDPTDEKNQQKSLKRLYNWYYCAGTVSVVVALTFIVYIQDEISWAIGFAIPSGCMALAVILFLLGMRGYVHVAPEGSMFSSIAQVFVASFRNWKLKVPVVDGTRQLEMSLYDPPTKSNRLFKLPLTSQLIFLNKAAIVIDAIDIKPDGSRAKPWKLCSVQQVEELKCLIKIIPIWFAGIICFIMFAENINFSILQASTMDRYIGKSFKVPEASLIAISYLAVSITIVIYDLVIVPLVMKVTKVEGGFTLLQRQGIGIVIGCIALAVAGVVETKRSDSGLTNGGISPMSVFWLTPQLAIMGIAEGFNAIGQIEFYLSQFPEHMRTLAHALFFCTKAGAAYLASVVVFVINAITSGNDSSGWINGKNFSIGRLDYFYYTVAAIGVIDLIYFFICARYYRYKKVLKPSREPSEMNETGVY